MLSREKRLLFITKASKGINGLYSELARKEFACSVTPAQNGVIEQVTEQNPDLVMLEMNGRSTDSGTWELPQRVKQARPLPIIALVNTVHVITTSAHTGDMGDGKIFVLPVENAVRVRTGEAGENAI